MARRIDKVPAGELRNAKILYETSPGTSVATICKMLGVSEQALYDYRVANDWKGRAKRPAGPLTFSATATTTPKTSALEASHNSIRVALDNIEAVEPESLTEWALEAVESVYSGVDTIKDLERHADTGTIPRGWKALGEARRALPPDLVYDATVAYLEARLRVELLKALLPRTDLTLNRRRLAISSAEEAVKDTPAVPLTIKGESTDAQMRANILRDGRTLADAVMEAIKKMPAEFPGKAKRRRAMRRASRIITRIISLEETAEPPPSPERLWNMTGIFVIEAIVTEYDLDMTLPEQMEAVKAGIRKVFGA